MMIVKFAMTVRISSQKMVALGGVLGCVLATVTQAQTQSAPYYQSKTIRLIVGSPTGGLYDQYARILARAMPRHIPGNPEIIVQNMPGGGSLVASNYVYGLAKPDGLTIGMVGSGVYLDQLLGRNEVKYDVRKFVWLGSVDQRDLLLYVRADTPWKSMDDLFTTPEPPKCGSTGGTADLTAIMTTVLAEALGLKFKIVSGYQGGNAIDLAFQRGEVNCRATGFTTHFSREPFLTWHKEGFDRHLIQSGNKRDARLPDTPTLLELMERKKTPEMSRRVARVMLLSGILGRPMLAPPNLAADRTQILREAYLKAFGEPDVIAEAKSSRLEIQTLSGEEVEIQMREAVNQPREVVERVKKLSE
jgi:tripartite-type tricarboxylate transporter receptor subunit TctC